MTVTEPWERQPNETAQAFTAFTIYRDYGVKRSHQKVAQELGKSRTLISRWSSQHSWVDRAQTFDTEQDRVWLTERRELLRKTAQRNAKIAAAAMARVAEKVMSLTTADLDVNSMARLMDAASKLEQLALGGPTSRLAVIGPNGGPVETVEVGLLTDEERKTRMQTLRRELSRRLDGNDENHNKEGQS